MLTQDEQDRIISVFKRLTKIERGDLLAMGEDWISMRRPDLHVIPGGLSVVSCPHSSSARKGAHGREHSSPGVVVSLKKQIN